MHYGQAEYFLYLVCYKNEAIFLTEKRADLRTVETDTCFRPSLGRRRRRRMVCRAVHPMHSSKRSILAASLEIFTQTLRPIDISDQKFT